MLIAATGDRIPAGRAPGRPRTRRPAGDRGGALRQGPPVPGATGPTHRVFYGGGISRAAGTRARAASRMDVLGGAVDFCGAIRRGCCAMRARKSASWERCAAFLRRRNFSVADHVSIAQTTSEPRAPKILDAATSPGALGPCERMRPVHGYAEHGRRSDSAARPRERRCDPGRTGARPLLPAGGPGPAAG